MKTGFFAALFILFFCIEGYGQRSKNGAGNIIAANTIVNEYTSLTADAAAGATTLTVASSTLNANGRFSSALASGDLLMIIQVQGASILGTLSGTVGLPNDSTWGQITNYNNCGNYEFVQVNAVPNSTTITIDCGLSKSYSSAGKVVVVRVPRYSSLTVNTGASLTCDNWNGTIGGIVAVEVNGNTAINGTGSITATGRGFRGGQLSGNDTFYNLYNYSTISTDGGGQKGEGIVGYQNDYTPLGGPIGRGAAANAGGGGNGWTSGGGGGGNAGDINQWDGKGNPDNSGAGWSTAWNLEGGNFSTNTSSGGGRGGYSWSSSNQNATTLAPGASAWGGDLRAEHGGLGGRPLDYSGGKIFLGGGGGAGDQDNNYGGAGGSGGGLIFLLGYGTVTGTGTIVSNGNAGANATGAAATSSSFGGKDAAGGGGAGGTIIINSTGTVSGITINANGGAGGNQILVRGSFYFGAINEAEGPGGGGGGGYIAVSNTGVTQTVTGGNNGTTNSDALTEFTPNGATRGGAGLSGQSISNYNLTGTGATVCSGSTASLSVTVTGTAPAGAIVNWYTTQTGGTSIGTGTTFTTPVLTSTTTYYAQLCPGTFRIPVVATVTAGLTVSVSPTASAVCQSGSVVLTATGGTTYSWNPSAGLSSSSGASVTATPSSTTTYTVTGTTGSCTDTSVAIVNVISPPTISISPASAAICSGNSTTLTASGGNNYTWTPSAGLSSTSTAAVTANPTATTTYTVTGTNAQGCRGSSTVIVTVNPNPLTAVSPATSTICAGSSVALNASGAATYSWTPSGTLSASTGATVTATPSSTITYTVTGSNSSCTSTATSIVNVVPAVTVTAFAASDTLCQGSSTTLSASGASTYTWSPAASLSSSSGASVTATPAAITTYTVIGVSSVCSDTAYVSVTVIPTITVTASASPATICAGSSSTLTASGATTYTWTPAASLSSSTGASVTANPGTTTTYTVTGNVYSCSSTASVILTVTSLPVVSVSPANSTLCSGGSVSMVASGASTYTWSPSGTLSSSTGATVTATPATTTTYTVTGTQSGCNANTTAIVNVASSVSVSINPASNQLCSGESVTLMANGAAAYSWSPATGLSSTNTQVVIASPATTTTYTVTGSSGTCSDTAIAIVQVTPSPVLTLTVSDTVICAGESVSFTAAGGMTYSWSGPGLSATTGSSVTATPTVTDTFRIVAYNGSCSDTVYQIITVNPVPAVSVSPTNSSICDGDTTSLTASGAGSYVWTPSAGLSATTGSSVQAYPGSTTTYTVTGNSSGCIDTAITIVNVSSNVIASVSMVNDTICEGSSMVLTASGGSTYLWSPATGLSANSGSSVTADPTSTTTYTLTVSAGTCSDTNVFVIHVDAMPVVSLSLSDDTICAGTQVLMDATGATTYLWSPSATLSSSSGSSVTATPSSTTTYTVIGYNGVCSDTASSSIFVNTVPAVSISSAQDSICSGTSMVLNASGASDYTWSPSADLNTSSGPTVTASPAVTTTFSVTGSNGLCTDTAAITLTVIDVNVVPAISSGTICEGDSIKVGVSGADVYEWNPTYSSVDMGGSYYLAPGTTTTYTITGTTFTCTDTAQVVITVEPAPVITVTATTQTICAGSSTSLSVTGATNYFWMPGTLVDDSTAANVLATPTVTTTFTVIGLSGNCGTMDTIIVNVIEPSVTIAASPPVICSGTSTLTASGSSVYVWAPSSTLSSTSGSTVTASPSVTSTYTVTGTDSYGCIASDTVTVQVDVAPVVSASSDQTTCLSTVTLSASDPAPNAGTWSIINGSGTVTDPASPTSQVNGLSSGTTTLLWTVSSSCGNISDTVVLNITGGPTVSVTASPGTICPGESSELAATVSNGTGSLTYSWSNAAGNVASQTVTPSSSTDYFLVVTDGAGCVSNQASVTVNVSAPPSVSAGADVTITKGESTTLTATGAQTYSWSPQTGLASPASASTLASPSATTIYTVTGTDVNGCTAVDEVSVTVMEKANVFIPDIFSPNADGRNDILFVRGANIVSLQFRVFDRWGEKVFETENQTEGWDGTFRGKPMDEAVYIYILRGQYADGGFIEQYGNITLIR